MFIKIKHSEVLYENYGGDKSIIQFEGDHNSPRPEFYYDSVANFFYNVLISKDKELTKLKEEIKEEIKEEKIIENKSFQSKNNSKKI